MQMQKLRRLGWRWTKKKETYKTIIRPKIYKLSRMEFENFRHPLKFHTKPTDCPTKRTAGCCFQGHPFFTTVWANLFLCYASIGYDTDMPSLAVPQSGCSIYQGKNLHPTCKLCVYIISRVLILDPLFSIIF
jgi:hypothetical protein